MNDAEFAATAGFTPEEAAAWEAVRAAAWACLELARRDGVHQMEAEEICHAFHDIQARLLARPALRALRDGEPDSLQCEWCLSWFERKHKRGPAPRFCSDAHRQEAHRANLSAIA